MCAYVTGPKEVKVLVDLAMISATGQGDLEVQKVSCLHAAATGYAPLIYEMRREMGFKEFLPLCQAVWRTLDVDDKLPEKFVSLFLYACSAVVVINIVDLYLLPIMTIMTLLNQIFQLSLSLAYIGCAKKPGWFLEVCNSCMC